MIDPYWLQENYPGLQFEAAAAGFLRIWNPRHPAQEMQLWPNQGLAKVLWPHGQQTFCGGWAEDFSSWDDDSEPWAVEWNCWRDGWLRAMVGANGWHVRPGKDRIPGPLRVAWMWLREALLSSRARRSSRKAGRVVPRDPDESVARRP